MLVVDVLLLVLTISRINRDSLNKETEVMAKRSAPPPDRPRSPATTSSERFQALQDGVRGQVDDSKSTFMTAAGIGGLLVVVIIFLLGRRSGQEEDDVRRDPEGLTAWPTASRCSPARR